MRARFLSFAFDQPWMLLIRALHLSGKPCRLRELADLTGLSPAGVQDVLRRLAAAGVVNSRREGNRKLFELVLTPEEKTILGALVEEYASEMIRVRSTTYGDSAAVLRWIDETVLVFRKHRRCCNDSP